MTHAPLLPKATAKWLIENTALSFKQIGDFCQLHTLEIEAIANDEVVRGMVPFDPIISGQATMADIHACEKEPAKPLTLLQPTDIAHAKQKKGGRYTPMIKRQDKPNAIAWILKHHPGMSDMQICKLLGTTKNSINAVRTKSHWNIKNIHSTSPVDMGLCKSSELEAAIAAIRPAKVAP